MKIIKGLEGGIYDFFLLMKQGFIYFFWEKIGKSIF